MFKIYINGVPLRIESIDLRGKWRFYKYSGSFTIENKRLTLTVSSSSLINAALKQGGNIASYRSIIDEVAKSLNMEISIRGPFGIKILEAKP
ncbi:MAG: hypothetical protein F7B11_02625 [Caldisphaeraceae archaeon]|nr:hypothetical protein [Caldisphaeraceae archaeon]